MKEFDLEPSEAFPGLDLTLFDKMFFLNNGLVQFKAAG